ncbi:hypothetical protein EPO15_16975, partial [bacterium]
MEADGKAVLVGTGSFMVDRAQALEKLMRFALPDPAWGVLSLARFAAASDARSFRVFRGPKGELTVRFDGTPPTRAQLERPYDALFSRPGKGEARGRDLAVGLLSLLRLEPAHILVRAGRGDERLLLRLNRADPEAVEPSRDAESDTVVRFMPGPKTPRDPWPHLAASVRDRGRMLPFAILLDGEPCRPPSTAGEGRSVRGTALSGWVGVPPARSEASRVALYRWGVLVHEVEEDLGGPPVEARVDCPAFRLNASQTAVVRDPAYKKALAAVAEAAAGLVEDASARHAERAPQLTQLLQSEGLRALWRRSVEAWLAPPRPGLFGALGQFLEAAGDQALDRELSAAVKADAARACWLREAAARPSSKAAHAAGRCPLYLAPDLSWLSRTELEETVSSLGVLPVADRLNPAPRDYRVLWAPGAAERAAAARWFPGVPVSGADDALDFAGRGKGAGARKGSLLSRLGLVEVVARVPLTGAWEGEVALPLQRPDAARIHVFANDELVQSLTVTGALRFVAAVTAKGPLRPQFVRLTAESVAERLGDLYAGAASDWAPGAGSAASEALRAHLFDALAQWGAKLPPWLASLPLFQCELGLFNVGALRQRLLDGDTLFFASAPPSGPAPQLLFAHPALTEAAVRAALPGARVAALPGRPAWAAAWWPRRTKSPQGGLEALQDLLREHGAFLSAPGSAERRYLLEALAVNFAPWTGEPRPAPLWARVREHAAALPLFRSSDGAGLTPPQLTARAASGRPLASGPAPGPGVELVLDADERRAFEALWPEAGKLLVAAPEPQAAEGPAAEPSGRPRLAFSEPMLVARELEAEGLRALVGLPPEPLPGVTVSVHAAGSSRDAVLDTPGAGAAGRMLLDVSAWKGAAFSGDELSKDLAKAARGLYIAFMEKLVAGGCDADPAAENLRPYLLMLATPRKGAAGPWAGLRKAIDDLPLFPTLGGGTASLADLRRTAAKEVLRCARRPEAAPASAAGVPVVTTRALVEAALGTALHDWSAEAVAPADGKGLDG